MTVAVCWFRCCVAFPLSLLVVFEGICRMLTIFAVVDESVDQRLVRQFLVG